MTPDRVDQLRQAAADAAVRATVFYGSDSDSDDGPDVLEAAQAVHLSRDAATGEVVVSQAGAEVARATVDEWRQIVE